MLKEEDFGGAREKKATKGEKKAPFFPLRTFLRLVTDVSRSGEEGSLWSAKYHGLRTSEEKSRPNLLGK